MMQRCDEEKRRPWGEAEQSKAFDQCLQAAERESDRENKDSGSKFFIKGNEDTEEQLQGT